jgi:hypothetical protein
VNKTIDVPPTPTRSLSQFDSDSSSFDDELFNDNITPSTSRGTNINKKRKRKRADNEDKLYKPSSYSFINLKTPITDKKSITTLVRLRDDDDEDDNEVISS